MSIPIWSSGEKKADRRRRKLARKKLLANFIVEYDLAYEGGGGRWNGYYRTMWVARIAAWYHVHVGSWGGSADLFPYPKPVPVEEPKRKKGMFRGRK